MNTTEARIQSALSELKMPAETFCQLARISSTRWSRALSGVKPLSGPECLALSDLVQELRAIINDATLIPVSLRDVEAVKRLLELRANGIKLIGSIQVEDTEPSQEIEVTQ